MKENEEALTAGRLRELMSYDKETGELTWRVSRGSIKSRSTVGRENGNGYLRTSVDGRDYYVHRLVWMYVYGAWPTDQIDHKNGSRADNRITNLRAVTTTENGGNRRQAKANSYTGLLGAHWYSAYGKFSSQIMANGIKMHLGYFNTAEAAHAAYIKAKRELHSHCTI